MRHVSRLSLHKYWADEHMALIEDGDEHMALIEHGRDSLLGHYEAWLEVEFRGDATRETVVNTRNHGLTPFVEAYQDFIIDRERVARETYFVEEEIL